MPLYTSITTTSLPTGWATRGDSLNNSTSMWSANTHNGAAADGDWYIQDSANNSFYLIKNTAIPGGVSLA